ncbi:hypothetical protein HYH02_009283 [Chlamydomonas schloesseri]|uniref:Uncharacterized protein n=1 Tax=Chlamydomonas schloesseri TaxID=2026947 RepID=A0A835TG97_9CHLO|nr:hypothetical protein HYH02_009283 [Chlamydomonas schloesseri]|eukprot:KAG2443207.1 hypothetical protein HYH02_009283 [Chlamydomonas schloesseri]
MQPRAGVPASSPLSPGSAATSRGARRLRTATEPPAGFSCASASALPLAASPRAGAAAGAVQPAPTGHPFAASALHHAYSMSYIESLAAELGTAQPGAAVGTGLNGHTHGHARAHPHAYAHANSHVLPTHAGSGFSKLVALLEEENERLRCALAAERRARLRAEQVAEEALSRLTELSQSQQQLVQQALQREASRARVERWLHAASAHAHHGSAGASGGATATTPGSVTPALPSAAAATAGEASRTHSHDASARRTASWLPDAQAAVAIVSSTCAASGRAKASAAGGRWPEQAAATVAAAAASMPASPMPMPHPEEEGAVPEPLPPCPMLEALLHEVDELARRRGDSDGGGPEGPSHTHMHSHAHAHLHLRKLGLPHSRAEVFPAHVQHSRLAQQGPPLGVAFRLVGCEDDGHEVAEQLAEGGACTSHRSEGRVGQPVALAIEAAGRVGLGGDDDGAAGSSGGRAAGEDVHAVCHVWRRSENGGAPAARAAPAAPAPGAAALATAAAAAGPCAAAAVEPCAEHQEGRRVEAPIIGTGPGGALSSARALLQRACTMSALPVGQHHAASPQAAPPALLTAAVHSSSSRQLLAPAPADCWHGSPSMLVATPPAMVPRPRMMTMGGAEGPWATAHVSSFEMHGAAEGVGGPGAAVAAATVGFASGVASGSPQAFAASMPRQGSLLDSWQQEPRLRPSDSGVLGNRASISSALHAAAFGSSPHARTPSQSGGGGGSPAGQVSSGAVARQALQHQHQQTMGRDSRRGSFAGAGSGQGFGGMGAGGGAGSFGGAAGLGTVVADMAVVAEAADEGPPEWSSIPLQ